MWYLLGWRSFFVLRRIHPLLYRKKKEIKVGNIWGPDSPVVALVGAALQWVRREMRSQQ